MYRVGDDSDVPAPYDQDMDLNLFDDLVEDDVFLEEARGDSAAKASKRTLAIVDEGCKVLSSSTSLTSCSSDFAEEKKKRASVAPPKSHGPCAAWVLKEIGLGARGDFSSFPLLEDAKKSFEVHSEYFLWCKRCGSKIGTRINVWQRHLQSKGHKEASSRVSVQTLLVGQDASVEVTKRARLAEEQVSHRIRVAKAVFSHSISINEVEQAGDLKELLEEPRPRRLTLGSSLVKDTKAILINEVTARYTAEFKGKDVLLTWDSTPRHDDVCAVLLSYITDDFNVVDRLASLQLFGRQLDGREWVDVILKALERYQVSRLQVLFGNSDRGGPNKPCVRTLEKVCTKMVHSWCIPHTLNRVGLKVSFPVLVDFQKHWNAVFKKSSAAQHIFWSICKQSWRRKSKVKWWTSFDQLEQVFRVGFVSIGKVLDLVKASGYAKKTIDPLLSLWKEQAGERSDLVYSLAAYHDVLEPFVITTHFLESAQFIAPFVYEKLSALEVHSQRVLRARECPAELPNLFALLVQETSDRKHYRWHFAQQAVRGGLGYFWELFHNVKADNTDDDDPTPISFQQALDLFRLARIFHPGQGMKFLERYAEANGQSFDEWRSVLVPKFVDDDGFSLLQRDLPQLVAILASAREQTLGPSELLQWWRVEGSKAGPAWCALARKFVLLRPSSALVERLFSIHLAALPNNMLGSHESTQELRTQLNFERAQRAPQ